MDLSMSHEEALALIGMYLGGLLTIIVILLREMIKLKGGKGKK